MRVSVFVSRRIVTYYDMFLVGKRRQIRGSFSQPFCATGRVEKLVFETVGNCRQLQTVWTPVCRQHFGGTMAGPAIARPLV